MKKWYQSKTIITNILMLIITLGGEATNIFPASKNPQVYASIVAVANILLRFMTTQQIEIKSASNETEQK